MLEIYANIDTRDNMEKDKYITLKEASRISGYAPDYIGQLIRIGKLKGKRIYCNVAWVTTREELLSYLSKDKGKNKGKSIREKIAESFNDRKKLEKMLNRLVYTAIVMLGILSIILIYIFSVTIESKLQQRTLEKVETSQTVNQEG